MSRALLLSLLLFFSPLARAELVLNEVLYDPAGSDGGHEFVELFCVGPDSCTFEDLKLQFVNGADPSSPRTIWDAAPGIRLAPGSFFVLGEAQVLERDLELTLGLQNGPDALWLLRSGQTIDRLAWGEVAELGEGEPAPDPSSTSLGRIPDGADSDDNRRDWSALTEPNPGSPNARSDHLQLLDGNASPAWLPDDGHVRFEVLLAAEGYAPVQSGDLQWWLDGESLRREEVSLARGESLRTQLDLHLPRGRHHLRAETQGPHGGSRLDLGYLVGASELRLNELMVRPLAPYPEWIELWYGGGGPDSLEGWSFADATRDWRDLPSLHFSSAGYAILTADARSLREQYSLPVSLPVFEPGGGWPTLNNGDQSGRDYADEVLLRDAEGVVVDLLVYRESELPDPGRTLERGRVVPGRARAWFASPGPATPGMENLSAAYAPPEAGLLVRPDPFTPDGDGEDDLLHIQLRVPAFEGQLIAEIRDLAGERVADLGIESANAELQQWIWDGRDLAGRPVPMGAYVVVVGGGGTAVPPQSWRALVALGRRS